MKDTARVMIAALFLVWATSAAAAPKHVIDTSRDNQYLVAISAGSGVYEDGAFVLNDVPPVVYFADRPNRIAGHMSVEEFVEMWMNAADLKQDPPNAAFATQGVLADTAVIEIGSFSLSEDGSLRMEAKVLQGSIPDGFDECTVFIDPITNIQTPGVY